LKQRKHFTYHSQGYLVGYEATELAIKKCKQVGVAVVGASGTYYTGMLSYYAEMAAAEDLVTVIASHCTGKAISSLADVRCRFASLELLTFVYS
jgi:LDH2 family malate/lactate/ureidoglycolate dehydrogenase